MAIYEEFGRVLADRDVAAVAPLVDRHMQVIAGIYGLADPDWRRDCQSVAESGR